MFVCINILVVVNMKAVVRVEELVKLQKLSLWMSDPFNGQKLLAL